MILMNTESTPNPQTSGSHHHHVFPWWAGYLLANPLRRLWHDPATILAPLVREGMTILEPGPGLGFFTIELARRVGAGGRVIALDVQPQMLAGLQRRVAKAGLADRLETRQVPTSGLGVEGLAGSVDFALVFAMAHEVPDQARFFREVAASLKAGGKILLAEPAGRVTADEFAATRRLAGDAGLEVAGRPDIRRSRTTLFAKGR